ncbi:MAG: MoaD/ThiS family protein [Actinobacteria bacterium]|nr:MoaD/ThiS family protein [Actinomycetota bacterium]
MTTVRIPTPLRGLTGGKNRVQVDARTVAEMIQRLEHEHPGFRDRILDESGELRRFVNIYVAGEDIRFRQGFATELNGTEEVSIIPAVAGG